MVETNEKQNKDRNNNQNEIKIKNCYYLDKSDNTNATNMRRNVNDNYY